MSLPAEAANPSFNTFDWIDDTRFRTKNFTFYCSMTDYSGKTTASSVYFLKDRHFIEIYLDLLKRLQPKNVLEIGFFEGGTSLFLAEVANPERIVSLDFRDVPEGLAAALKQSKHDGIIKFRPNILQDDRPALAKLIQDEFGGTALDLVIDDCSHEYLATKASFETAFGYLKPGGMYLIEDWGWAHLDGVWRTPQSYFEDRPALTNFIFELTMLMGSAPDIVSRIEILSPLMVAVTRGPELAYGQPIDIKSLTRSRGNHLTLI